MARSFPSVSALTRSGLPRSTALLLAIAVAACGENGPSSAEAPTGGEAPTSGEAPAMAAAPTSLPNSGDDYKDASNYRLTMPKVKAYVRAAGALDKIEAEEENTVLDPRMGIAAHVAALEGHAGARSALAKEGLTAREFALIKKALFDHAILALDERGRKLINTTDGFNGENVTYVEQNRDELMRVLESAD